MAETAFKNMLDPGTHRCTWKRFLAKSPWNFDAILREMLKSLPADLEPELANCDLIKMVIANADANVGPVRASGRPS